MLINTFIAVTVFINLLVSSVPTTKTITTDEEVPYEIISRNNVECIKASRKSDRVELRCYRKWLIFLMPPNIIVYDGCNMRSIIHYESGNGYLRWRSRASNSIKIVFHYNKRVKRWLTFCILSEKDWVEVCHEYKEYPYLYQEHHPRPENKKHKPIRDPTTMPTTMPTIKTEETILKKQSGSFSSLNYPNNYPTNVDYFYKIKLNNRTRVCLNITDMELRKENDNTPCKDDNRDYIKILDGLKRWSKPLLKICSMKDITGIIMSTNNQLSLRFFSDGSETFRGFIATYEPCKDSTETRKTNQVTGVVIGTGCGLIFLCLTFLALCHSRRCRRLCLQKDVEKYFDHADVVEEEGPPAYCDVMASPDKFPTTTDSTNNSEELPPYPGLPQNDNMIPKTSQQSLNDAGYISQEIEEDVLEKSVTDANEQEVEVSIKEAEETNVAADDEKAAKEKVENAEFIDDDKSTWDESETQDFQHPKSINTVV